METYLLRQAHDLLLKAKHPLFISDERIDGDSLGSSLAVVDYLKRHGKDVKVYVKTPVPERYYLLPHIESCTDDLSVFDDTTIDLVATFDCSDGNYIEDLVKRIPKRPIVMNVDHHATNPFYGDMNLVQVGSPATAEVVYQFFLANQITPSREAATCLLTGICFDTTVFSNNGTNEHAFRAASNLVLLGARISEVLRIIYQNRSVSILRLWGVALERLRRHAGHGIVATFLTRRDFEEAGIQDYDEVDGLSDFLNIVINEHTVFVMRETKDGGIKVSMRSQKYNVAALAKTFGGGGHVKAAGFTIPNTQFSDHKDLFQVVEFSNL